MNDEIESIKLPTRAYIAMDAMSIEEVEAPAIQPHISGLNKGHSAPFVYLGRSLRPNRPNGKILRTSYKHLER
jgi:hypothetical protein